ncbi:hypothetical protein TrVE_jg8661 [Triparma verrucosa]|uniref:Uncharacterized protein n=1 Tax=Triparma verrucosa TaxID=1606542 RepID=A0A9W7EL97_9STRA|nr:hypothetical protein TrVE_jg8661 [Triparma verrucosa]
MEEKDSPQPSASLSPQQSFREINSVPTAETAWGTHSPGSRHSKVTESKTTKFYNKNFSEVGDSELGKVLKRRYVQARRQVAPQCQIAPRLFEFRAHHSHHTRRNLNLNLNLNLNRNLNLSLSLNLNPTLTTSTISKKPLGLTSCERHLLSKFAQETFPFIQELISYCKTGNFHPRKAELVGKFLPIALEKIAGTAADSEQDFENASITSKTLHKYLKARGKSSSNYLFIANKLRRAKLVTPEEMYKWKEEMQALNSRKGIEKNDSACPIEDLLQNLEETRMQPGEERCTMNEQETAEKGIQ